MEQNIALALLACAGGCAARISRTDVRAASSRLPGTGGGRVIVGHSTGDDAALVTLTEEPALVEALDIFSPIIAALYDHGGIAAADAPGEIHVVAAQPTGALGFVAWPADHLSPVHWFGCRSPDRVKLLPADGLCPGNARRGCYIAAPRAGFAVEVRRIAAIVVGRRANLGRVVDEGGSNETGTTTRRFRRSPAAAATGRIVKAEAPEHIGVACN